MSYGDEVQAKALMGGPAYLGGRIQPASAMDRLRDRRENLESQLAQVNEAIAAMEGSPEAARVVDALIKLGGML